MGWGGWVRFYIRLGRWVRRVRDWVIGLGGVGGSGFTFSGVGGVGVIGGMSDAGCDGWGEWDGARWVGGMSEAGRVGGPGCTSGCVEANRYGAKRFASLFV